MTTADSEVDEHEALLEFVYLCPVGIAQLDGSGEVAMMNPVGARILMEIAAEPVIDNFFDALGAPGNELRALVDGLSADQGTVCESHRITFDLARRAIPLTVSFTLIKLSPARIMAVIADESRSAEQERTARRAEHRVKAVLDGVRDYAIFGLDRACRIESWNKSAERLFGYAADEVLGRDYLMLFPRDTASGGRQKALSEGAVATGWGEDEGWWARKETTRFWGSSVVSVVEEQDGARSGFIVVTRDLTRKKREEDDLREAAAKDFLTGLYNRRTFEDTARQELQRWQRGRDPLSLLMIDADHFKRVNDTHGHAAGDEVLRALARAVQDQVRELDVVARLGGEEFVVLMPSTDAVGARAAAERIRMAVEALRVPGHEGALIRFTVSVGIAEATRDAASVELLLQRSDEALYEAKHRGRNRCVVAHPADPHDSAKRAAG
ncbi:MAG: diguanylate cyclase with sensor [Labilithrix sp.]|nr:diguanylate cyclase with sensor [Labilithrix sp.]